MVVINLLPWREAATMWERKVIKRMLSVTVMLTFLILLVMHQLIAWQYHAIEKHIRRLHAYESQTKNPELTLKANESRQLQEKLIAEQRTLRQFIVALGKPITDGVCFTEMIRDKKATVFIGKTASALDLTNYLRTWNAATQFADLQIEQLTQQTTHAYQFRFVAHDA